eukprot:snap_masked-scaffold_8-processed-gene-8.17-mRNA-1 protein AED:1.00 eAED:1.00 QI:0/0/0/0/1/1/2/0/856
MKSNFKFNIEYSVAPQFDVGLNYLKPPSSGDTENDRQVYSLLGKHDIDSNRMQNVISKLRKIEEKENQRTKTSYLALTKPATAVSPENYLDLIDLRPLEEPLDILMSDTLKSSLRSSALNRYEEQTSFILEQLRKKKEKKKMLLFGEDRLLLKENVDPNSSGIIPREDRKLNLTKEEMRLIKSNIPLVSGSGKINLLYNLLEDFILAKKDSSTLAQVFIEKNYNLCTNQNYSTSRPIWQFLSILNQQEIASEKGLAARKFLELEYISFLNQELNGSDYLSKVDVKAIEASSNGQTVLHYLKYLQTKRDFSNTIEEFLETQLNSFGEESIFVGGQSFNIFAVVYYFLRCGLAEELLEVITKITDVPNRIQSFVQVLRDFLESGTIGMEKREKMANELEYYLGSKLNCSPWQKLLLIMFSGESAATQFDSDEDVKLLIESVQDYLWVSLFSLDNSSQEQTLKTLKARVMSSGPSYFIEDESKVSMFFVRLLFLTGGFVEAINYLVSQGIEAKVEAIQFSIALRLVDRNLLGPENMPSEKSMVLFESSMLQQKSSASFDLVSLMLEFISMFKEVNLKGAAFYLGAMKLIGIFTAEVVAFAGNLLNSFEAIDLLLDGPAIETASSIPLIYTVTKNEEQIQSIDANILGRQNGLLYKIMSQVVPHAPIEAVHEIILSAGKHAYDRCDFFLSTQIFLRSGKHVDKSFVSKKIVFAHLHQHITLFEVSQGGSKLSAKEVKAWVNICLFLIGRNSTDNRESRLQKDILFVLTRFVEYLDTKNLDCLQGIVPFYEDEVEDTLHKYFTLCSDEMRLRECYLAIIKHIFAVTNSVKSKKELRALGEFADRGQLLSSSIMPVLAKVRM